MRSAGFIVLANILDLGVIRSALLASHTATVLVFARKCYLGQCCAVCLHMLC